MGIPNGFVLVYTFLEGAFGSWGIGLRHGEGASSTLTIFRLGSLGFGLGMELRGGNVLETIGCAVAAT